MFHASAASHRCWKKVSKALQTVYLSWMVSRCSSCWLKVRPWTLMLGGRISATHWRELRAGDLQNTELEDDWPLSKTSAAGTWRQLLTGIGAKWSWLEPDLQVRPVLFVLRRRRRDRPPPLGWAWLRCPAAWTPPSHGSSSCTRRPKRTWEGEAVVRCVCVGGGHYFF